MSLLLAFALLGCSAPSQPTSPPRLTADDHGLVVEGAEPFALSRAMILSESGTLLAELPAAGVRRRFELPFLWEPGRNYRVVLETPAGTLAAESLTGPAAATGALRASVQLPFGQTSVPIAAGSSGPVSVLAPPGAKLQMSLLVENQRQAAARFKLEIDVPAEIELLSDDPTVSVEPGIIRWSGTLELEHEYAQAIVRLTLPDKPAPATLRVHFRELDAVGQPVAGAPRELTLSLQPPVGPGLISLEEVAFPCDIAGDVRPEQSPDSVLLADPVWSRVRRLLRPTAPIPNEHEPTGWQAVRLKNDGPFPVSLRIESEVAEGPHERPLLEFAPTVWIAPTESPVSEHLLAIGPRASATAVLPLYVRREVRPGHYVRRVRVYPVGSSQPLVEIERPLDVIRGDAAVSASVLAALAGSLAALVLVAWRGRRVVAGIGVEGLATIGMMSAVQFAAAYLFRISSHVLAGVLGPFAVFVTGVGNEGVSGLLMAVTITLVPRVGAASLTLATLWVLNSLFTGQFGLVDIEFLILSCLSCETALALLGVTSTARLRQPHASAPWSVVLRVALALGAAKGVALYLDLCLVQVLYRLYFAPWYVLAVALCVGLGYGAVGAAAGTVLGYQLRRTAG